MAEFAVKQKHKMSARVKPLTSFVPQAPNHQRIQIQNILRSTGAQAKLTIGQPNDKYEQEADAVADKVMGMSDADVAQRVEANSVQPMQIQRMCDGCEEETAQRQPMEEEEAELQAKEMPGETPTVSPNLESRINSLKGGGQPLDSATRSFFEPRFGHDFSKVRIHADSSSADTAKSINARAFTLGNHVVMGSGEYQPESQSGQHLLGHELTHVIQQSDPTIDQIQMDPNCSASDDLCHYDMPRSAARELFLSALKAEAQARLDKSKDEISEVLIKYAPEDNGNYDDKGEEKKWDVLRESILIDHQLFDKALEANSDAVGWRMMFDPKSFKENSNCNDCHYKDPASLSEKEIEFAKENYAVASYKTELLFEYRSLLRQAMPEIELLNTGVTSEDNASMYQKMIDNASMITTAIDDVSLRIEKNDMPLSKLEPVLTSVISNYGISEEKRARGDVLSTEALNWVDHERNIETTITVGGALLSGVLGLVALGALFVPGGWAATAAIVGSAAGVAGASIGFASALYSLEIAEDLNAAAQVGDSLVTDPKAEKDAYLFAQINLSLSILDSVFSMVDVAKLAYLYSETVRKLSIGRKIGYGHSGLVQVGDAISDPAKLMDPDSSLVILSEFEDSHRLAMADKAMKSSEGYPAVIIGKDREPLFRETKELIEAGGERLTSIDDIVASQGFIGWNPTANVAWMEGIIQQNKPVYFTHPFTDDFLFRPDGTQSFFGREVEWLFNRGYKIDPLYSGPALGRLIRPEKPSLLEVAKVLLNPN